MRMEEKREAGEMRRGRHRGSGLCAGVGVVVCGGRAVASLDGEADVIFPLFLLLLQLLPLLQGTIFHSVFRGHGGVATRPVLFQGGAPVWISAAGVLQTLGKKKEGKGISICRSMEDI